MFGSKSKYFHQSKSELEKGRLKLYEYLELQNYTLNQAFVYSAAYRYFCEHPDDFDGATIVKDLHHIPGLDINAMLHDYHYLTCNASANLYVKWYCDLLYAKEMEKLGKGYLAWFRWFGLKVTGIPFLLVAIYKRGFIKYSQEVQFFDDYKILMK